MPPVHLRNITVLRLAMPISFSICCFCATMILGMLFQLFGLAATLQASESSIPDQDMAAVEALRLRHAHVPAWGYEVTWVSPRWAAGQTAETVRVGAVVETIDGRPAAWVDTGKRYFDGFTDSQSAVFRQPDGSLITINHLPRVWGISVRWGVWYQGVLHEHGIDDIELQQLAAFADLQSLAGAETADQAAAHLTEALVTHGAARAAHFTRVLRAVLQTDYITALDHLESLGPWQDDHILGQLRMALLLRLQQPAAIRAMLDDADQRQTLFSPRTSEIIHGVVSTWENSPRSDADLIPEANRLTGEGESMSDPMTRAQQFHPYNYLQYRVADRRLNFGSMLHLRSVRNQTWSGDSGNNGINRSGFWGGIRHLHLRSTFTFDAQHDWPQHLHDYSIGFAYGDNLKLGSHRHGQVDPLLYANEHALTITLNPSHRTTLVEGRSFAWQQTWPIATVSWDGSRDVVVDLWRIDGELAVQINGTTVFRGIDQRGDRLVVPFLEYSAQKLTHKPLRITGYEIHPITPELRHEWDQHQLAVQLSSQLLVMAQSEEVQDDDILAAMDENAVLLADILEDILPEHTRYLAFAALALQRSGHRERAQQFAQLIGEQIDELNATIAAEGRESTAVEQDLQQIVKSVQGIIGRDGLRQMKDPGTPDIEESFHKNGQLRQRSTTYATDTRYIYRETFHNNGVLREAGYIQYRRKIGLWRSFDNEGNLRQANWMALDGVCGWQRAYFASGRPQHRGISMHYLRHYPRRIGQWSFFHDAEGSPLRLQGNYVSGKRNGLWHAYYASGQVAMRIPFVDGRMGDDAEYFDRQGAAITVLNGTVLPSLDDFSGEDLGSLVEQLGADDF